MELYIRRKGKLLRRGLTTGTCAAAASKAATIAIVRGDMVEEVSVKLPDGESVALAVYGVKQEGNKCSCYTIKDAGDDPDVTNGIKIWAEVELRHGSGVVILGGKGVGIVTKPGLQVPVGAAAINPVPREMITREVASMLPLGRGAVVRIIVPEGIELAKRTMNSKLGIIGGISIIGTTGVVEPKSLGAFRDSLVPQIDIAMAAGYHEIVLTPGRRSERMAVGKGIPQDAVVQTGNFIGFMLKSCASRGLDRVLLFGGLGKLSKLSMGYFYTHSGTSPRGTEAMARLAIDAGAEGDVVKSVRNANTTDEAIEILIENGLEVALNNLAEAITFRAREYVDGGMEIGTAIVSLNGDVVGRSNLDGSLWGRYMS